MKKIFSPSVAEKAAAITITSGELNHASADVNFHPEYVKSIARMAYIRRPCSTTCVKVNNKRVLLTRSLLNWCNRNVVVYLKSSSNQLAAGKTFKTVE
jgi:hypothetical protein